MAKTTKPIKTIKFSHGHKVSQVHHGAVTVSNIYEPYGEFSKPVTSIGVTLHSEENESPDWIVHIPLNILHEVIDALNEAKKVYDEGDIAYHPHDELAADTGGGA